MKNAAGHPVPPSALTLTPKLSNFWTPVYQKTALTIRPFFLALHIKVGLGTIDYIMIQHTSQYTCHDCI